MEWIIGALEGGWGWRTAHDCVEVATNLPGVVGVRDSKDPAGAVLTFPPYSWRVFVAAPPR